MLNFFMITEAKILVMSLVISSNMNVINCGVTMEKKSVVYTLVSEKIEAVGCRRHLIIIISFGDIIIIENPL